MNLRDGAEWYRRGQHQLATGDIDQAIDSFHRATVNNRANKQYVLGLARALARKGDVATARGALLALRASVPEDRDVNLQLARLAAERGDVPEALRYYHNTLYAPWPAEQADARRDTRLELIRFLLAEHQTNQALSEVVAVSAEAPETPAAHVQAGRLFAEAGDHQRALDQFQRALRLAPDTVDALEAAGTAAFQIGEYALARGYLRRAPGTAAVRETLEVADLVLSRDPLAGRIRWAARRRRVADNLSYAEGRLDACSNAHAGAATGPTDAAMLRNEATWFKRRLKSGAEDEDTVEDGVDLVSRIARLIVERCPPAAPLDRALILIGRRHEAER
jgi:Tfp pilus assembly protein PilF